jgi:hypothetical protein
MSNKAIEDTISELRKKHRQKVHKLNETFNKEIKNVRAGKRVFPNFIGEFTEPSNIALQELNIIEAKSAVIEGNLLEVKQRLERMESKIDRHILDKKVKNEN